MKFKVGKKYGNDLTIEVLKRTEKTITIKSSFGVNRIKVRDYGNGIEAIMFKAWYILATEEFDFEKAKEISMYNSYYR